MTQQRKELQDQALLRGKFLSGRWVRFREKGSSLGSNRFQGISSYFVSAVTQSGRHLDTNPIPGRNVEFQSWTETGGSYSKIILQPVYTVVKKKKTKNSRALFMTPSERQDREEGREARRWVKAKSPPESSRRGHWAGMGGENR